MLHVPFPKSSYLCTTFEQTTKRHYLLLNIITDFTKIYGNKETLVSLVPCPHREFGANVSLGKDALLGALPADIVRAKGISQ